MIDPSKQAIDSSFIELNFLIHQFESAFSKQRKEESYEELNNIFNKLLNKLYDLYTCKKYMCRDMLSNIVFQIEKIIQSNDCPVLYLILDPNAKKGENIDQEMKDSAKAKINRFQRKGLVYLRTMDHCLNAHHSNPLLERLATKVTYICHWGSLYPIPDVTPLETTRDQGNNIINRIIPLFSDSKQTPRLKRFILLGCETAAYSANKASLYITDDINKISTDTTHAYSFVLTERDSKKITGDLYFVDANKILSKVITNCSINESEQVYFKKVIPTLKKKPPQIYKNDSQFYGKKSMRTLESLHFHIYEHTERKIQTINGRHNHYVERILAGAEAKKYLVGKSDSAKIKLIKKQIPSLGSLFRPVSVAKENESVYNIALKVESILNQERKDPVEVKAYAELVKPMGDSIVPQCVGSNIPKAIIYKR